MKSLFLATIQNIMFTHPRLHTSLKWFFVIFIYVGMSSCFKDLPNKTIVYENNFEDGRAAYFQIYSNFGLVDSFKISSFNNTKVFGNFNTNYVLFKKDTLPDHNAINLEFDLYIHDKWDGNFLPAGASYPDLWQMAIDNNPVILTSFSNGAYSQSYPDNYQPNMINNKPLSNAWELLPGICAFGGSAQGTSHYKINYTTSHFGPLQIAFNDVVNPVNSLCLKSWSIDNLRITAIQYK